VVTSVSQIDAEGGQGDVGIHIHVHPILPVVEAVVIAVAQPGQPRRPTPGRRHGTGAQVKPPQVVNLTLLPVSAERHRPTWRRSIGAGRVVILSRGYGNCRITNTRL
jgi:hypothetical protein